MVYIDTIGSYIPENYLNNIYEAEKNNNLIKIVTKTKLIAR